MTRFVIHLQEKWKYNLPRRLWLLNVHKSKPEIRTASYVTMVVGSIYCDKIVHTKMHLLSTTWQTCIDAYSRASLKSNRALIYRIEGTETVNFTMLKGTIFVGYQNKNFLLCAKLPYSSNFPSRQNCVSMQRNDDEITIHWRSFIIVVFIKSKKEGKDQKSIQSSTTPDQGQHNGKEQKHNKTPHTREPRDQPFSQ